MSLPFDEINTLCRTKVIPTLVDNYFKTDIIAYRFLKNASKWRGGHLIEQPIEYTNNSNAESYAGAALLSITDIEVATKASLPPRQYNAGITITGIDLEENKGDAKILDLIKVRTKNAMKSLKDLMGTDFYASQAGTNLDGVGGVYAATAGTAYAGINPTDFSKWKCNGGDGPKLMGAGALDKIVLNTEIQKCADGADMPTIYVTTSALFAEIEADWYQAKVEYQDKKLANLGFDSIRYKGRPLVWDPKCPSGDLYGFNESYLKVWTMPGMNFKFIPFAYPTDKDIKIAHIRWYGNLLCTNVSMQMKIDNIGSIT